MFAILRTEVPSEGWTLGFYLYYPSSLDVLDMLGAHRARSWLPFWVVLMVLYGLRALFPVWCLFHASLLLGLLHRGVQIEGSRADGSCVEKAAALPVFR